MSKTFEEKNWPQEFDKAVAYTLNFVSMAYGYGSDVHEDYFKSCCEKNKSVSVHYKDFEFPKSKTILKPYLQLDWYFFAISPDLKKELVELGLDDDEEKIFRPVWTRKHDFPICYSIEPQHILKPIAKVNNFETEIICDKCNVVWAYHKENEVEAGIGKPLYITQESLSILHDFNVTYEFFGPGGYLIRKVIVSKKIHDFIINKYPRAEFRPVLLAEDNQQNNQGTVLCLNKNPNNF